MLFLPLLAILAASAPDLPTPIDIPAGPPGVTVPAEQKLPGTVASVVENAPALAAGCDVAFADESLIFTGENLAGAHLRIWTPGLLADLVPTRTASQRLQAVLPADWPRATTLVWPVSKSGLAGRPMRINGPRLWWCWPPRVQPEGQRPQRLLLMGKNLHLGDARPSVHLVGPSGGRSLNVVKAGAYQLAVELPGDLARGQYRVWAHSGTAGSWGWSDSAHFEVLPPRLAVATFSVEQFGARPDDDGDDSQGIQAAIDAAAKAGGGRVTFAQGVYHLAQPLRLPPATSGIHLAGAGVRAYTPTTQTFTGPGTLLQFHDRQAPPQWLVDVACPGASLRDLSLLSGHPGAIRAIHTRQVERRGVIRVVAPDVVLQRVNLAMLDLRPPLPQSQRQDLQIYDPALHLLVPGKANISVQGCQFHSAGAGIEIGTLQAGHTDSDPPDPSTDYIAIEDCVFRGYSPGFYKDPVHPASYQHMGIFNEGVNFANGKYTIVQRCDFAGADRRGGKMLNRSVCVYNTSVHDLYIADNRCHDVGMTCPRPDRLVNQSEQIIFHFRYPHGGYFDVLSAGAGEVTLRTDDPRNAEKLPGPHTVFSRAGSRVLPEVGTNDHWIALVSRGRGMGQWRVVRSADRQPGKVRLQLAETWRVTPDATSRITLGASYRHNIIAGNSIDAGFIDPKAKVAGVLFWFNAVENIIAGNTLRNLGYGAGFNSTFRNPCAWNLVCDNQMEHLGGLSVECLEPTAYIDTCRLPGGAKGPLFDPNSDVSGWYALGNVARHNQGRDAARAAVVSAELSDKAAPLLPQQDVAGVLMPVVEHNQFTEVGKGIVINRATLWPVLRKNSVQTVPPGGPAVFDQNSEPH